MSKLWTVHRNPRRLKALARLSGLAAPDLVYGGPTGEEFVGESAPAAILIGVEGDFELELEFLHRYRNLLERSKRRFLAPPEDASEVARLFSAAPEEVLDSLPSERELRAFVIEAVAHRNAETLVERRDRERIAHRFASWFDDLEVPGLLRALDPALARLSLLVRGVPGSGRSLLARYVELFRVHGAPGPTLRVHASEITDTEDLVSRLLARERAGLPSVRTIWIDDIDRLSVSLQRSIAEWIRLDAAPVGAVGSGLRWIATAAPSGLTDRLEPDLERAFVPLSLLVPSLADHPEALAPFAQHVASEWATSVGGVTRLIGTSAIEALEAHAWSGDRASVEAVLRSTLAATSQNPIEERDLASGQTTFAAESEAAAAVAAETEEPVADAVYLEAAAEALGDTTTPEAQKESGTSAASLDEFEQAFLDGLPEAQPGALTNPPPAIPPNRDLSSAMREETFENANADTPAAASPGLESTNDPKPAATSEPANILGSADAVKSANSKWRRLARSLSHEIRNPLVSIRTFAELLPEHFADESFRERFSRLVGRDVAHIEEVVSRLASAAEQDKQEAGPVDVSNLMERLLDQRRDQIGQERLLVLRELERDAPIAWADAHSLEVALAGLLDRALASLPERGDLFVATRHIERAADGAPRLRVLLRHRNPELAAFDGSGLEELGSAANVLEYVLAETILEAQGGTLTLDSTDAQETLILVDLRTPA